MLPVWNTGPQPYKANSDSEVVFQAQKGHWANFSFAQKMKGMSPSLLDPSKVHPGSGVVPGRGHHGSPHSPRQKQLPGSGGAFSFYL